MILTVTSWRCLLYLSNAVVLPDLFTFSVACFFLVKYLNAHTGVVFLRFPKRCYKLLWSALPFITNIESRGKKIPCFLNCLHVGGKEKITVNTQLITNHKHIFHTLLHELNACLMRVFSLPTGTIRTCQKFLIRYNTQQLHRMLPKCKNEGEWFPYRLCNVLNSLTLIYPMLT